VAELADLGRLGPLEDEWRKLAEARGNAFLTPEWVGAWARHYGEEQTPFVPVLRGGDGALRGLLPLALPRSGHPRVCRIAGANLGDRFHPVCQASDEAEVAAAAGEALAEAPEPWTVISLNHADVAGSKRSRMARATGSRPGAESQRPCP
jgi:CelD/BcsL family acetyltransferase involved in cellulose biosynthesis